MTVPSSAGSVYGRLCVPEGATTVQVLVPGGTYSSAYWDIGHDPRTRSYRLAMNTAGIATLAVDRLGSGRSSKPSSLLLGVGTQAEALHAVVRSVRPRFDRVVLVGHSVGSAIAVTEAATHHDVDGVVVTGLTHQINLPGAVPVFTTLIPAPLSDLPGYGLDLGYLTTSPGSRYASFHTPAIPDPAALAFDEATKTVVTPLETVDTVLISTLVPMTRRLTVPVMLVMGAGDANFCGPRSARTARQRRRSGRRRAASTPRRPTSARTSSRATATRSTSPPTPPPTTAPSRTGPARSGDARAGVKRPPPRSPGAGRPVRGRGSKR
ncbi:alpha/beta hydrolase [Actinokineospora soli]|uniref:Alpha/beta hydrolase n=1 Tax=Actinokineospora soli TaxID=1048753 RepID=A0ABW2TTV0_9PSEU